MDKKNYYIIGGVVAIFGVIYFLARSSKRRKLLIELEEGRSEDKSIIPQETQVRYGSIFPLRKGSGYDSYTVRTMVKNVQVYINKDNLPLTLPLIVDGMFGERTESHLVAVTGKKEVSKEDYQTMIFKL